MNRSGLIRLLESYAAPTTQERLFKRAMLDFAHQHPDCLERSNLDGHFTASAWLIHRKGDKALLMHHRKLDGWFQLGGHADGDPSLLDVAMKEAMEESGIDHIVAINSEIFDLDIHEIPANPNEPRHFHYDVRFLLHVASDEDFRANNESKELRWIGKHISELPTNSQSVVRMFEKWVSLTGLNDVF